MRLVLILVFTASFPIDAASACHRFSIWRYPHPQRCSVRPVAAPENKDWYVEIVPSADDLRATQAEALKRALKQ